MKPGEAVGIALEANQRGPLSWLGTSSVPHFWGIWTFGGKGDPNQAPDIDAKVRNAVALTGDEHLNWANDVKVDYKDPASPVLGSELACTSMKSTGNGTGSTTNPTMAGNPHLKFTIDNRCCVNTKITKDAMTADFRVLECVTTPGAPVSTKASFEIRDGVPGLVAKA